MNNCNRQRRKKARFTWKSFFFLLLALILWTSICFWMAAALNREKAGEGVTAAGWQNSEEASAGGLYSHNAVLIRTRDCNVMLAYRVDERIYPASMTKIMTAILAIEALSDRSEQIRLEPELFEPLYRQNASMAGFEPGEEVAVIDLLYGVMLPSGAECCAGLARRAAGSEEAFVEKMNQKAAELGMKDTHFSNADGLHHPEHYSTVRDIALLLEYALENETFREIFTAGRHSTAPTNFHPDGITFYSTLFGKLDSAEFPGGEILGGKTGFTEEAGQCLASLAVKDGEEYILVTAGAPGNHGTDQFHFIDAFSVYQGIIS